MKAGKPTEQPSYKEDKLFKLHGIKKPSKSIESPEIQELRETTSCKRKIIKEWNYVNGLYLNETHKDITVNYIEYIERSVENGEVLKKFEWITDIPLTEWNVKKVGKAGRSRWKVENETFNTLKNQGYHFGHNFGHGEENLCTNLALLMMLAFLIDQVQQYKNELFQQALKESKAKKYLWDDMRSYFKMLPFDSMEMIYKAIIYGVKVDYLTIQENSE